MPNSGYLNQRHSGPRRIVSNRLASPDIETTYVLWMNDLLIDESSGCPITFASAKPLFGAVAN